MEARALLLVSWLQGCEAFGTLALSELKGEVAKISGQVHLLAEQSP